MQSLSSERYKLACAPIKAYGWSMGSQGSNVSSAGSLKLICIFAVHTCQLVPCTMATLFLPFAKGNKQDYKLHLSGKIVHHFTKCDKQLYSFPKVGNNCTCMTYLALVEAFHLEVQVGVSWVEDKGFPAGEVQDYTCMTYQALVEAFHLEELVGVSWVEDKGFPVGEVQDCTCMTYQALVEAFHLEELVGVSWVEDQMMVDQVLPAGVVQVVVVMLVL